MMVFTCPYCQLDTSGNHAPNCPNGGTPTWITTNSGNTPSPIYIINNQQLERIERKLDQLFKMLLPQRNVPCIRCGKLVDCPTTLPYGTLQDLAVRSNAPF